MRVLFGISLAELLLDWRQSADEVIVKLRVGVVPLRLEEVDAAFTDTDCVVRFPGTSHWPDHIGLLEASSSTSSRSLTPLLSAGGRQWGGVFYAEIESSCAKVQARKGGLLQLALPKKVPLLTWPSLLVGCRAGEGRDFQCS